MEYIARYFGIIFDFFRMDFTIFGFTLSFWDVLIWTALATMIIYAIKSIFE